MRALNHEISNSHVFVQYFPKENIDADLVEIVLRAMCAEEGRQRAEEAVGTHPEES